MEEKQSSCKLGLELCRSPMREALTRYFVAVNESAASEKLKHVIDCFESQAAEVIFNGGDARSPEAFYNSKTSPVLTPGFRAEPDFSSLICSDDGKMAAISIRLVPGGCEKDAMVVGDWFTVGATGRIARLLVHGPAPQRSPVNHLPPCDETSTRHVVLQRAQPYPYTFPLQATALVLIDFQGDFLLPAGFGASLGNDLSHLERAVAPAANALKLARQHSMKVVHTREGHRPDLSDLPASKKRRGNPVEGKRIGDQGGMGRILVDGEEGCAIIPALAPLPGELDLLKPGKGAFCHTGLEAWLLERKISHLLIAGVTTEVCVQTTMREANDRGFECCLLKDAAASYFPKFHDSTVEMVTAQGGIVGWTTTTAELEGALTS